MKIITLEIDVVGTIFQKFVGGHLVWLETGLLVGLVKPIHYTLVQDVLEGFSLEEVLRLDSGFYVTLNTCYKGDGVECDKRITYNNSSLMIKS